MSERSLSLSPKIHTSTHSYETKKKRFSVPYEQSLDRCKAILGAILDSQELGLPCYYSNVQSAETVQPLLTLGTNTLTELVTFLSMQSLSCEPWLCCVEPTTVKEEKRCGVLSALNSRRVLSHELSELVGCLPREPTTMPLSGELCCEHTTVYTESTYHIAGLMNVTKRFCISFLPYIKSVAAEFAFSCFQ